MEINNTKKLWIGEVGCWVSQGINLFICVKGATADETTSSRIGKYKKTSAGKVPFVLRWPVPFYWVVYNILSRIPYLKGHFVKAIEADEGVSYELNSNRLDGRSCQ